MTSVAAPVTVRFTGRLADLTADQRTALLRRELARNDDIASTVTRIIADVASRGDAALFAMAVEFDGVTLATLEVPHAECVRALEQINPALRRAMERSARNIERVHLAFAPRAGETEPEAGVIIGRRPDPLQRVGVYAPGGRASYPSSVLMTAIPARVAGVREIILASPPSESGLPPAPVLAAAALSGVTRVFAIGGAGAVAALAFGTESVPRVDRIFGPGSAYVAAAKQCVVGQVGIDSPAGPSELLVIADVTSDPEGVARELVAQAEHDPLACVVAVAVGAGVADAIAQELAVQTRGARRATIVQQSLAGQGAVLSVDTLDEAIDFANAYAAEHLMLAFDGAVTALPRVRNAGSVFVGAASSVAFGDYITGANHVLPTGGSARAFSGLSPLDFVRWTTYQRVDRRAAAAFAADTATFADAEGLFAHAAAARAWSASP